jgi:hypothetical protein
MAEPCTILSLVATPTECVDGYYSLDITVTFSNPPGMINGDGTTGTLFISTNCGGGGSSPYVIPGPFPDLAVITETATITGIIANGVVCTLSAYFESSDPYAEPCEYEITYEAPKPCLLTWPYYSLVPCCGGRGITLRPESKLDQLAAETYVYNGPDYEGLIQGQCYTVIELFAPNEDFPDIDTYLTIPLMPSNVDINFTIAKGCNDLQVCPSCDPVCYTLYSCDGLWFNTISDLSAYVGTFVTINESGTPIEGTWYVMLNSGDCDNPVNEITVNDPNPAACKCTCFEIIGTVKQIIYVDCNGELQKLGFTTDAKFCAYTYPFVKGTAGQYQIIEGDGCIAGVCPVLCYELTECNTGEVITSQSQSLSEYYATGQVIELVGHPGCWQVNSNAAEDCTCPVDVTVTIVHTDCPTCLGITAYKLTNCENLNDIKFTYDDLSEYVGLSLRTDCGCYTVELINYQPTSTSPIVIISSFNSCLECLRIYYELTDCNRVNPSVYTYTDLSTYVGQVINIKGCDTCFEIVETDTPINPGIVTVTNSFLSCIDCTPPLPCLCNRMTNYSTEDKDYQYLNCNDETVNLKLAPGQTSGKICLKTWIVDYPDTDNLEIFGECTDLQDPKFTWECPETRPKRKIKPGYSVPTCDIEKWENITCRSSEILYKEVMRLRYGMSNCCPEDDEKWLVKKELIDLAALVDPDYICKPVQSCGCAPSSCGCGCSSTLKSCSSQ